MHSKTFLSETAQIASLLDVEKIEEMAVELVKLRERKGRLFIIGIGGSAANASHAVNDFRKLCCIEAYAPTDNIAELTARTNDEGFDTIFSEWLKISQANDKDAMMVFSVGGGGSSVSANIWHALAYVKMVGLKIFGIVGRDTGYTSEYGDIVIVVPTIEPQRITPHTEAFQAVIWHCLVSHPDLQIKATKW